MVKKARSMIYLIRKAFKTLSPYMMLKIYKTCQTRIGVCFSSLEVQRSFTKLPRQLKNKPYEERLKELNLTTHHKERGDLIEMYKVLSGHYDLKDFQEMFKCNNNNRLRGHHLRPCIEK